MGRSTFRLQALLDRQRHLEEQKALELADLAVEERRIQNALAQLRQEERALLDALEALARRGAIDPVRYQETSVYLGHVERVIREETQQLREIAGRVTGRRAELQDILKEKQSLERLRERQDDAEAVEDARREARGVDDLVSSRYARRQRDGGLSC